MNDEYINFDIDSRSFYPNFKGYGVPPNIDALQTCAVLNEGKPADWLVVDHYGVDNRWETAAREATRRILAIDDLADRRHDCDVLLDQNLSIAADSPYAVLVPAGAKLLVGYYGWYSNRSRGERNKADLSGTQDQPSSDSAQAKVLSENRDKNVLEMCFTPPSTPATQKPSESDFLSLHLISSSNFRMCPRFFKAASQSGGMDPIPK